MCRFLILFLLTTVSVSSSSSQTDNSFGNKPKASEESLKKTHLPRAHHKDDIAPNHMVDVTVLPENPEDLMWQDDEGRTQLHHALRTEPSMSTLKDFLDCDVNQSLLRITDNYGRTPLHVAVEECQMHAISLFLQHDTLLLYDNAFSILQTIASHSSIEPLSHLMSIEPKLFTDHLPNGATAVFGAFYIDMYTRSVTVNNPMVAYLCRHNPDLITKQLVENLPLGPYFIQAGTTPLMLAQYLGFQSTYRLLQQLNIMEKNGTLEFFSW